MCGILGSLNFATDEKSFTEALKKLTARGPDDSGVYYDKYVFLGNTRLSIIDLDYGHQPIQNENGTVITVFNGEIYNYLELKAWLKKRGHIFKTNTDTEVLVHLYEEHGVKMAEYLDGMFAFAIWDREKRKLLLCRDHFGKKPLVYYFRDNILVFASETKALLAFPHVRQNIRLNQRSLVKYLFYGYVPSPNSIYDKVYRLRPATLIEFYLKENTIHKKESFYWDPLIKQVQDLNGDEEILKELDSLLNKAIRKRLMSDVPLGAFLSGGTDSGLIVAHLSKLKSDLETFTVTYENRDYDESFFASRTATHLKVRNTQYNLKEAEVLDKIPLILSYLDEPMADASIIPAYFISKFAGNYVKVVLSGDGGDELFGGYLKYIGHKVVSMVRTQYWMGTLLTNFGPYVTDIIIRDLGRKQAFKMFFSTLKLPIEIRNFLWTGGCFLPREIFRLLGENITLSLEEIFEDSFFYGQRYNGDPNSIQKALYLDTRIQLPDWYLLKTDWASMANSLEVRSPLLDKDLAEFVFSIPFPKIMKRFKTKSIFKKLLLKYLPSDVVYKKKQGFGIPLGLWMRGHLKEFVGDHLSGSLLRRLCNQEFVESLFQEHLEGKADNTERLWRLVLLEHVLNSNGIC